ncbi:hypothetical protein FGO68_gene12881 [Halteria grandinella]|uniref:Uncharacterized protein n=1 Tax=Halteria grandinella TaxID=5974 RepID=A0A8J8SVL9_HALGN|nr:hypothetical protein FGO68_gene12881 [Halteria grandinella]
MRVRPSFQEKFGEDRLQNPLIKRLAAGGIGNFQQSGARLALDIVRVKQFFANQYLEQSHLIDEQVKNAIHKQFLKLFCKTATLNTI